MPTSLNAIFANLGRAAAPRKPDQGALSEEKICPLVESGVSGHECGETSGFWRVASEVKARAP
jgi:hypothetical protein